MSIDGSRPICIFCLPSGWRKEDWVEVGQDEEADSDQRAENVCSIRYSLSC